MCDWFHRNTTYLFNKTEAHSILLKMLVLGEAFQK